jgi:hypothetical protein
MLDRQRTIPQIIIKTTLATNRPIIIEVVTTHLADIAEVTMEVTEVVTIITALERTTMISRSPCLTENGRRLILVLI